MKENNNLIIYKNEDGNIDISVKLENETIWLTQKTMAELFECSTDNISLHLKNIYQEEELNKNATTEDFSVVQIEGNRQVNRTKTFYNLDAIIAVGYRVNSKRATQFRIWATNVLRSYLTKGYAVNERQLKQEQAKVKSLQDTINLLSRSLNNQVENLDEAKQVAQILNNFATGLDLLDDFDHKTLETKGKTTREAVVIEEAEYLKVIKEMKAEFASDVFANPKDGSFASSINQIYQTFGGEELYPTLEEKAAMLLYLITKNHSFSDGNKRIAASCFLYFMEKNKMLYQDDTPIIDNATLFSLTLLIAESNPSEMETIKNVVVSVLNRGKAR
ncbi:MAG: virulence protein RhuM/Fic/DOC family protein [Synergistaceae bacterium]|nr:virulence protein RhuM/Fic/DOC family protein [Synergistaceae bacterium]